MSFLVKALATVAVALGLAIATGPTLADASIQTGDGWCWGKAGSCSVTAGTDQVCRSVACSAPGPVDWRPSGIEYRKASVTGTDSFCTPWKFGC